MPLTLITGPANAAKAGAVFARLRAALPRDPLLVVPTSADREHYQRELAASGIVFGAEVLRFDRLMGLVAAAAGLRGARRSARWRAIASCARRWPTSRCGRSRARPARPGSPQAAGELFAELQRSLVTPARFTSALRAWGDGRAAYADELAALYAAYRRRLEQLGRPDREGYAWAALDALRAAPAAWGGRPVFFYGFDDLTPTQRDALETLSGARRRGGRGRAALRARAASPSRAARRPSRSCARSPTSCTCPSARSTTRRPPGRRCTTWSARCSSRAPQRRVPNGAVRLLEAGGERAEAELVGAEVLELMRHGIEARDIAVLLRGDAGTTALFAQVLAGYGIPVAHDRRVALAGTRLGAGVLAGARGGAARRAARRPADLAADAGAGRRPRAGRRAGGARSGAARCGPSATARLHWEQRLGGPSLSALDVLAGAAEEGPEALLAALEAEAEAIWTAPHRRRADVLGAEDLADARVAGALRGAAAELRGLAREDPALLGTPHDVLEALAAVEVREPSAIAAAEPSGATEGTTSAPGATAAGVLLAEPAGDPRAALPGRVRVRPAGRRVPGPPAARAVPVRRGPARADGRRGPAAAAARGRARPRALPVLRGRLAPRGRALPVLALVGRGGRPAGAVGVPRRRPRAVHRGPVGAARHAAARRRDLGAARRADAARAAARLRRRRGAARARAAGGAAVGGGAARAGAPRDRAGARAGGVRRLRHALADRAAAAARPHRARPGADAARLARAHACSSARCVLLRERTGSAGARARAARRRAGVPRRRAGRAGARRGRRRARGRCLRGLEADLERYLRTEAECGAGYEPAELEWSFGRRGRRARPAAARRRRPAR